MNNWKAKFESLEITEKRLDYILDDTCGLYRIPAVKDFIEYLLQEQRKEVWAEAYMQGVAVGVTNGQKGLINKLLEEAPEDIQKTGMIEDMRIRDGFNQANQLWRKLLQSKLK